MINHWIVAGKNVNFIMRILILHGPQLSLLGKVSSQNKSRLTLDKVNRHIKKIARDNGLSLHIFHLFARKNVLKTVLTNRNNIDAIVMNLGGMARDFYALQEMLAIIQVPVVEIALSEFPLSKETFDHSAIREIAVHRIYDKGLTAYDKALSYLINKNN